MAETKQIMFTYRELAEMMVRQAGLKEGLWGIVVRFGIGGANVGQGPEDILPAAIVPVLEIGLQRVDELSRLAVDAAEVATNGPASKKTSGKVSTDFKPGQRVRIVQRGTITVGGVTLTNNVLEGATIVAKNPDGSYQVSLKGLIDIPGGEEVTMPAEWVQGL